MALSSTTVAAAVVVVVACLVVLTTAPIASAEVNTPPTHRRSNMRGGNAARLQQLQRMLVEGETPQLLSLSECSAMPVDIGTSPAGSVACQNYLEWQQWPYSETYCGEWPNLPSGNEDRAGAMAVCTAGHSMGKLWAPHNNAERCVMTDLRNSFPAYQFYTGINDIANEGVWVGPDGEAIDPTYLNWHEGQPDGGTAENCVVFIDNAAADVACDVPLGVDQVSVGVAMCHHIPVKQP